MATHSQETYRTNQTNSMSYTETQADFSRKFSLGISAVSGVLRDPPPNSWSLPIAFAGCAAACSVPLDVALPALSSSRTSCPCRLPPRYHQSLDTHCRRTIAGAPSVCPLLLSEVSGEGHRTGSSVLMSRVSRFHFAVGARRAGARTQTSIRSRGRQLRFSCWNRTAPFVSMRPQFPLQY